MCSKIKGLKNLPFDFQYVITICRYFTLVLHFDILWKHVTFGFSERNEKNF